MRRLLVFQHVAFEMLGTLHPLLKSYGFRIRYVNFGRDPGARPSLDGYDGLVVLGGPMSAGDDAGHPHLPTEVELIGQAIERELPVLGICLGAQLIARTLGAQVAPNPVKEIGWYPVALTPDGRDDPVLAPFEPAETLFQWHGDRFEIPSGAVHLATSAACPNQAFRYGDRIYGFQFHLEVNAPLIERWLTVPSNAEELAALGGQIDPETVRRDTPRYAARLQQLSDLTFARFIELFSAKRRRNPHPHHR